VRKQTLDSPYEEGALAMPADGIENIVFEVAAHVYYWDGMKYAPYATSD
jgi:hypothetical protein